MMKPRLWIAWILCSVTAVAAGSEKKVPADNDGELFVVVMTEDDTSTQALFDRYPEVSGSWEELAKFNLLRSGHAIEIPRQLLSSDGILAKVGNAYGDVEVKRVFDRRFIPVVANLLLREGDELRTWNSSGVRIRFEDGSYVFVNSHTKVKVVSLGEQQPSAASRLQILLKEGSVWSRVQKQLNREFEIRTSTASTIIRGTHFRVKVEPGDATRVEILEGSVDFQAGGEPVSVRAQQGALAVGGGKPITSSALPPPPQSLDAPGDQEVIRSDEFDQLFRWSPVASAVSYHLVIARDDQFFDVVDEREVGREASVRIPSMEPGTYFWRVSAFGSDGFEGSFSESRYFVFVRRQP